MLLAGTGPGEYVTNGAAAGPVVAAGKGTPREEESGEMSLSGRAINEPISASLRPQARVRWNLEPRSIRA